jgi:hypothetical protein
MTHLDSIDGYLDAHQVEHQSDRTTISDIFRQLGLYLQEARKNRQFPTGIVIRVHINTMREHFIRVTVTSIADEIYSKEGIQPPGFISTNSSTFVSISEPTHDATNANDSNGSPDTPRPGSLTLGDGVRMNDTLTDERKIA